MIIIKFITPGGVEFYFIFPRKITSHNLTKKSIFFNRYNKELKSLFSNSD